MRILLDLQGCQSTSRFRDVGRCALSLAKAMARNAGGHEIWVLLSDQFPDTVLPLRKEFAGSIPPERIAVFSAAGPTAGREPANAARARVAELVREYAIAELRPDVMHVSSLFEGFDDDAVTSIGRLEAGIPTAVTVYEHLSEAGCEEGQCGRDYRMRKISELQRADLVFAISASVGRDAASALGFEADRIVGIAPAADDRFRPAEPVSEADLEFARRIGLSLPFVLHVEAADTRRKAEALIRAFAALPQALRAAHQLCVVDPSGCEGLRRLAASLALAQQDAVFLDHTAEDDRLSLYRLCRLFVAASFRETIGLQTLEAMACGAAVIGSNTGCLPEVIGREDALFDLSSPGDMAETMRRALADEAFNRSLREHGLEQSRKFSWDISAKRILNGFETLLAYRRSFPAESGQPSQYRRLIAMISGLAHTLSDQDLMGIAEAIAAARATEGSPRLLLDVSRIVEHDERTGIQRVVRAVSKALLEEPPPGFQVVPVWFDPHTGRYRYALRFTETILDQRPSDAVEDWVEACRGDLFLGLDLAYDRVTRADSWLRVQRRRGVKIVFVVYDTLPVRHPEWFPDAVRDGFAEWVEWIADVSDLLLTISEAVADDLRDWLVANVRPAGELPEVRHFHLGSNLGDSAPSRGLPDEASEVLGQLARTMTFLTVGTLEPRKGHRQLLDAFERLWENGVDANLVIVGKFGWMAGNLAPRLREHPRRGRQLFWLEAISDEYLEKVYAASTCLVAASEGEGFGLPLIEGAQHGLPIIARDLPVFREVAGEHAYYFSGTSPEALADAVSIWMALHAEGKAPSSQGMSWLSWAQSARQLMEVVLREGDVPSSAARVEAADGPAR